LRILKELSEAIHQKEYQIIFEKQNKMEWNMGGIKQWSRNIWYEKYNNGNKIKQNIHNL
jgi:hypothetical protein